VPPVGLVTCVALGGEQHREYRCKLLSAGAGGEGATGTTANRLGAIARVAMLEVYVAQGRSAGNGSERASAGPPTT